MDAKKNRMRFLFSEGNYCSVDKLYRFDNNQSNVLNNYFIFVENYAAMFLINFPRLLDIIQMEILGRHFCY